MSDHFDADDLRTDLTDIYLFPATRPGRTVLIACFNPEPAETDPIFDPAASYELKLDTDDDAVADVAFHVRFSAAGGRAVATVRRATGADAAATGAVGEVVVANAPVSLGARAQITDAGGYRFFAGVRSDRTSRTSSGSGTTSSSRARTPSRSGTSPGSHLRSRPSRSGRVGRSTSGHARWRPSTAWSRKSTRPADRA